VTRAPVGVLGGGGFGRGLATAAARGGRSVVLWSRSVREVADDRIHATTDISELARCELVFVAVPSQHVAEITGRLGPSLDGRHLLVHVSRGLVGEGLETLTSIIRRETPVRRVGVLGGPLNAYALEEATPGGAVVGTRFPEVTEEVRAAIGSPSLRIYATDDVEGVEVGSAMVGLIALMIGFAAELGMGPAALAIFGTRGISESARLAEVLGGRWETLAGLAGVGDLLAALAGDGRPELLLGAGLARGLPREEAGREAGAYIEGVGIASRVARYSERHGLDLPIARAAADVLEGGLAPERAVERLMTRKVGTE